MPPPKKPLSDSEIDNMEILPKLCLTIKSWEGRRYLNTDLGTTPKDQEHRTFTDINETRRQEKLAFLKKLLDHWHHYRRFSEKQRVYIRKAAKGAGITDKEVRAHMAGKIEKETIGEFAIPIPPQEPGAKGGGGVAPGETGHATPEERTRAGLRILGMIVADPVWPDRIGDRDYEFLKSLFDRSEAGRLREISVKQYTWIYNCYERYILK
jgi:hypothetical protein